MSKVADLFQDMTEMYDKGYRYFCAPQCEAVSPSIGLYAKDLAMVAQIHRDWPTQVFTVIEIEKAIAEMTDEAYDKAYQRQSW